MKTKLKELNKKQNSFKDSRKFPNKSKRKEKEKKCLSLKLLLKPIQEVDINKTMIVQKN